MPERVTTANGYEITNPTEKLSAQEYRAVLAQEYGIDGASPQERITQLKQLSNEGIAIFMEYINKGVQGSEYSLINESTTFIGNVTTIRPENRYEVFTDMIASIREAPDTVNPARVADVLALGVVLLHPFRDGNGRTARIIGLTFRDDFDEVRYTDMYNTASESRDTVRQRGGYMINGYAPNFPEGFDQSDPAAVTEYLRRLLWEDSPGAYTSCFDQPPLENPQSVF